jgi:hypothetical protein
MAELVVTKMAPLQGFMKILLEEFVLLFPDAAFSSSQWLCTLNGVQSKIRCSLFFDCLALNRHTSSMFLKNGTSLHE